jgi:hypothetical protein
MFKPNPLAGVLDFRSGGSVPLVGGVTLAAALQRVDAAEAALSAARAAARAAAKREGKSTRHLFDGHPYVARASAERWCDEARREGEKAVAAIFSSSIDADSADASSPFHFLAKRLKRSGLPPLDQTLAAVSGAGGKGAAILAAARTARRGGPELPEPTGLAAQIVAAGKRARTPTGNHEND